MASNGKIRVFVNVGGLKSSRTFPTKQKAKSWAAEKEVDLRKSDGLDITFTLGQLFDKCSRGY